MLQKAWSTDFLFISMPPSLAPSPNTPNLVQRQNESVS